MGALATVEDLEARFRKLNCEERRRAEALIGDASAMLVGEMSAHGIDIKPENEVQAANLRAVCCSLVRRSIASGTMGDFTQSSMTAGPYTQSWTFANPSGDMYLTKAERRLLGISGGVRVRCVTPYEAGGAE